MFLIARFSRHVHLSNCWEGLTTVFVQNPSKFASAVAAARPLEIATLATVVVWSLLPWQWGLRTGCRVLGIVGSSEFFFALVFGRSRWFGGRKVLRRASMFSGCWCEGYLQLFGLLSNIVGGLLKFRPGTTSPFWELR